MLQAKHSQAQPRFSTSGAMRHHQGGTRSVRMRNVLARSTVTASIGESLAVVKRLKELMEGLPPLSTRTPVPCQPQRFPDDMGDRVGFVVSGADVPKDGVVMSVPESLAVTRIDAEDHELVGGIAAQSSELTALTLLLLAERAKGDSSPHSSLFASLPECTLTPLLWEDAELDEYLAGSPVLPEAKERRRALEQQWQLLHDQFFSKDPTKFPAEVFGKAPFMRAFSVVMGHAVYLPSAECFALMPIASLLERTGNESAGCTLDYDADSKSAVLTTPRPLRNGTEILISDPRPNSELILATGRVYASNPSDFLLWKANLIQTDRYFMLKNQVLESLGYGIEEEFPVYADKMPTQLLAYLRMARVQDPGLLAKVNFEKDIILSDLNEYEILQILMGDCRERLQAYPLSVEEEIKYSQDPKLSPKQRLACQLRTEEKRIISGTMDGVRNKLAPIRGIPTKQGLQNPNQDLLDIFAFWDSVPRLPQIVIGNIASWARGDTDPDWKKKPSERAKKEPKSPRPW
mmetsp:Transcript_4662/g.11038  ORF Transcript_4662/g.11038 Transcript_4662/m.11038 type:complete len:518 (-) Transcript_4662:222-1775(-)